jgi:lipid-binding SYLF domain-containing protein
VFPTIGKGGFFVGAARGEGRVYEKGRCVGDTTVTQVSLGFQLGGEAYSEIIFFQTPLDLARFESGKFALGAQASAIAITAGASASASTAGSGASASGTEHSAVTAGHYQDGIAVFTIAQGRVYVRGRGGRAEVLLRGATIAGNRRAAQPPPGSCHPSIEVQPASGDIMKSQP